MLDEKYNNDEQGNLLNRDGNYGLDDHNSINVKEKKQGSLFRSEDMEYIEITMLKSIADKALKSIGNFGLLHVVDLNRDELNPNEYTQKAKKKVVDCASIERKLDYIEEQMLVHNITPPNPNSVKIRDVVRSDAKDNALKFLKPIMRLLEDNVTFVKEKQLEISELIENRLVLEKCRGIFIDKDFGIENKNNDEDFDEFDENDQKRPLMNDNLEQGRDDDYKFKIVNGIIPVIKQSSFERLLFRVTRGNAFVQFFPIDDPIVDVMSGEKIYKSVFSVVYLSFPHEKIKKLYKLLQAREVPTPKDPKDIELELKKINKLIAEIDSAVTTTENNTMQVLEGVAFGDGSSPLRDWQDAIRKEMLINDAKRKCFAGRQIVRLEGWIPKSEFDNLKESIQEIGKNESKNAVYALKNEDKARSGNPPTYFQLNEFTSVFQAIVNTYGVPTYKEANPGLFTIVSFPFLFGVMYGDVGHGTLLLLVSLYFCLRQNHFKALDKKGELTGLSKTLFTARWLFLLMALFAVYCGAIYNDTFSIPTDMFGSQWKHVDTPKYVGMKSTGKVYPFGVDPGWYHTKNELLFFNSLKMKMAVTIGVTQMLFGVFLSLSNHIYFKDYASIILEFIPRFLFLGCLFGYMIFMIIYKMCVDWQNMPDNPEIGDPPQLIQTMIGMFLNFGGELKKGDKLYHGQEGAQMVMVGTALAMIPLLFFGKPCWNKRKYKQKLKKEEEIKGQNVINANGNEYMRIDEDDLDEEEEKQPIAESSGGGHGHGHGDGPYSFGDDFVANSIHSIEYILGAVSNTASYLRLWALSLAHAELANVFFEKFVMDFGVKTGNPFFIFGGVSVWFGATFAVLLGMDVLEAFLHALRLQWVEFQNKFYEGAGFAFEPFTFVVKKEGAL